MEEELIMEAADDDEEMTANGNSIMNYLFRNILFFGDYRFSFLCFPLPIYLSVSQSVLGTYLFLVVPLPVRKKGNFLIILFAECKKYKLEIITLNISKPV